MAAESERDQEAFRRRVGGRSFGAIARELEFRNAPAATEAFLRVLRQQDDTVRAQVRVEEHQRLDDLEGHVANDADLEPDVRSRRLAVVARMRRDVDLAAAGAAS